MTAPSSPPCLHPDFAAWVVVARVVPDGRPETADEPAIQFAASVKVDCAACGVSLRVIDPSVPVGDLPARITVDVPGTELRVKLWPDDGTDPPRGHVFAGFTVRQR